MSPGEDPGASAPAPDAPPAAAGGGTTTAAGPAPASTAGGDHEPAPDKSSRDPDSKLARRARYLREAPGRIVRTYPATVALIVGCLVVQLISGAAWSTLAEHETLRTQVSYGAPALASGRVWTFLVGMFFTPTLLWVYLPILVLLAAFAVPYERRAGHVRLLVVVIGGQMIGTFLTAVALLPFRESTWTWAHSLAHTTDVGISGGLMALIGALSALMQEVWRTRVRVALTAYLIAMVLNSGYIWDVEHLFSWTTGLLLGPLLVGRMPRMPHYDFNKRAQRALVALIIAVIAISGLVDAVNPGNGGPFYDTGIQHESTELSVGLMIFSLLLLAAADGLRRGHRVAWIFITALTLLSVLALVGAPSSAERTADLVLNGAQLLLLLLTFRAFRVRSRQQSVRKAGRRLVRVVAFLFVYTALGFLVLQDDFTPDATPADMLAEFVARLFFTTTNTIQPATTAARWFVGSIGAIWLGAIVITIIGLIYSSRRVRPQPEDHARMREMLHTYESSSIGWMLTWKGNIDWFSSTGNTAIGYRRVGSVALALGDPVGPMDERLAALQEFDRFCFDHGWIPCFFAAGEETAAMTGEVGWQAIQVAEDDIVPLKDLAFKGKSWQDIRTAMNKAAKSDITLQVLKWEDARPVVRDQLHAISEGWVSDKSLPEMGFTLGTLREADDPEVRLHIAVAGDGTIEGFTSWMPVCRDGEVVGWCLDLMRRRDEGEFRPVMEFLIGGSAMQFKEEGFEFLSLSAAPLAKAPDKLGESSDQVVLQRLLDFLGDALEPYYGFRSLLAFKTKFQPINKSMYLVFPDEGALVEIGIAIARAYMPEATAWDWAKMGAEMVTTPSA
jgi:phosphatidylglycerol lysyltransferase